MARTAVSERRGCVLFSSPYALTSNLTFYIVTHFCDFCFHFHQVERERRLTGKLARLLQCTNGLAEDCNRCRICLIFETVAARSICYPKWGFFLWNSRSASPTVRFSARICMRTKRSWKRLVLPLNHSSRKSKILSMLLEVSVTKNVGEETRNGENVVLISILISCPHSSKNNVAYLNIVQNSVHIVSVYQFLIWRMFLN